VNCIGLAQQESNDKLSSGYKSVTGSCEHSNELSDSIKASEFLGQLSKRQILKMEFCSDWDRFGFQKSSDCASLKE
jgi:hypothetical protein